MRMIDFAGGAAGMACAALTLLSTPVAAQPDRVSPFFTNPKDFTAANWTSVNAGAPLNLAGYTSLFHDDFNSGQPVCPEIGMENGKWDNNPNHIWWSDSGAPGGKANVQFADARNPINSLSCASGHLTITLSYNGLNWQGGEIKTYTFEGQGFQRRYGYWEVAMSAPRPPAGLTPWASIWFNSRQTYKPLNASFSELDIFESGMHRPDYYDTQAMTIHRWPAAADSPAGLDTSHQARQVPFPHNIFDGRRHTYGLKVTPQWNIVYWDRREVARFPTLGWDTTQPEKLLIDMTLALPPTAPTSTTYSIDIYGADYYACPPNGCS